MAGRQSVIDENSLKVRTLLHFGLILSFILKTSKLLRQRLSADPRAPFHERRVWFNTILLWLLKFSCFYLALQSSL